MPKEKSQNVFKVGKKELTLFTTNVILMIVPVIHYGHYSRV